MRGWENHQLDVSRLAFANNATHLFLYLLYLLLPSARSVFVGKSSIKRVPRVMIDTSIACFESYKFFLMTEKRSERYRHFLNIIIDKQGVPNKVRGWEKISEKLINAPPPNYFGHKRI